MTTIMSHEHPHQPVPVSPGTQEQMEAALAQSAELTEPYPPSNPRQHGGYELLIGHKRTDGSFKPDEQLRTEYIQNTDELILQMTDGVYVTDPITKDYSKQKPDYIVYLDKSGRPVEWLVRALWSKLAPAPGEEVPPMPPSRFVNIDREQWVNTIDPEGVGRVDIDRVDRSIIRSLRSVFVSPSHKREGLTDKIDTAPAELDGKTVLIVDEVISSGKTLDIARAMFAEAFPTAKIAGTYWMAGQTQKGLSRGNADLPVWYVEKSVFGRGVGNRDEKVSQSSENITQKLGSWFLSSRFPQIDPSSLKLRAEINRLADDKNVLIMPSIHRDDFEQRAIALNGVKHFSTFLKRKHQLDDLVKRQQPNQR